MPRQAMPMPLAFDASQHLDLPVQRHAQRLADYLRQEERLLAALLDERQLTRKGPGEYRYLVTKPTSTPRTAALSGMPASRFASVSHPCFG